MALACLASPFYFRAPSFPSLSCEHVLARLLTQFASTRLLTLDDDTAVPPHLLQGGRGHCVDPSVPTGLECLVLVLVVLLSCPPHRMMSTLRGRPVFVLASVRLFQAKSMCSGNAD